jgi:hypothetical protein
MSAPQLDSGDLLVPIPAEDYAPRAAKVRAWLHTIGADDIARTLGLEDGAR